MLSTEEAGAAGLWREQDQQCDRCGGLLVPDWINEGADFLKGGRCVICGERLDPTIVKNRLEQSDKVHRDRMHPRKPATAAT